MTVMGVKPTLATTSNGNEYQKTRKGKLAGLLIGGGVASLANSRVNDYVKQFRASDLKNTLLPSQKKLPNMAEFMNNPLKSIAKTKFYFKDASFLKRAAVNIGSTAGVVAAYVGIGLAVGYAADKLINHFKAKSADKKAAKAESAK